MLTLTIRPQGYMANQMIQYMFAKTLQALTTRESRLIHYNAERFGHPAATWREELQDWGINFPEDDFSNEKFLWVKGNDINFDRLIKDVNSQKYDNLVICGPLVNLRYYFDRMHYRNLFKPLLQDEQQIQNVADDELIIHIRGGDIMQGAHRDYFPLPYSYYHELIRKTGLKPVFTGQIGDDIYSEGLKKEFAGARFLERRSVIADFESVRRAKNIAGSVSSFAWLSGWLSATAEQIYYPVAGILNPFQRNDIDLVPRNDTRYHYYKFDRWKFNAKKDDFAHIMNNVIKFQACTEADIPFFKNRIHRGIHNKFKFIIPVKYNTEKHRPLSLRKDVLL
jgi:hypothetical protein